MSRRRSRGAGPGALQRRAAKEESLLDGNSANTLQNFFQSAKRATRKRIAVDVEPPCSSFPFLGYQVSLPEGIQPYKTQKKMIVKILMGLNAKQNVMIESPTGSGKTLGLLSSTCEWLVRHKMRVVESIEKCPVHGQEAAAATAQATQQAVVKQEEPSPKANLDLSPLRKHSDENVLDDCIIIDDVKLDDSRIGFGHDILEQANKRYEDDQEDMIITQPKQLSPDLFEAGEPKADEETKQPNCTCEPRIRVYYASRTHRQISQVVKEFSRLIYGHKLKHTILGSREQLCVNQTVRSAPDLTAKCKELLNADSGLGCQFREKLKALCPQSTPKTATRLREYIEPTVWDVESLKDSLGERPISACPYFAATRVLTLDSDIIFCPFSYLIDPIIRESSDVHLKNSVVILDEAHNVEDFCRESATFLFHDDEAMNAQTSMAEKCDEIGRDLGAKRKVATAAAATYDEEAQVVAHTQEQLRRMEEYQLHLRNMERYIKQMSSWIQEVARPVKKKCEEGGSWGQTPFRATQSSFNDVQKFTQTMNFAEIHVSLERHKLLLPEGDKTADGFKTSYQQVCSAKLDDEEADPDFLISRYKPSSEAIVFMEKMLHFQTFFLPQGNSESYRMNVLMEEEDSNSFATQNETFSSADVARRKGWQTTVPNPLDLISGKAPRRSGQKVLDGWKTTIGLWCMNPSLAFQGAFSSVRSVVLASGTLTPTESFESELGMKFHHKLDGEQVIPPEQIFASVVNTGPAGLPFIATYKHTSGQDNTFSRELARVCLSVSERTPGGVLCFFPSYRLMAQLTGEMDRIGIMKRLKSVKAVFSEPRRSSDLKRTMDEYSAAIQKPETLGPDCTGAIMFAVFRGKVSEGIDFTDELARCVISVGIPFPNTKDEQVLEKKKFNDERRMKSPSDTANISGDAWYTVQAYRALNQAIGRCLRHQRDWGAIVLVDQRLSAQLSPQAPNKISGWVRACLRGYSNYGQFERELEGFMRARSRDVPTERHVLTEE
ncbi:unnamed protein product, partial [Mesorhabditis spiculigera]